MDTPNIEFRDPPAVKNGSPGQVRAFVEELQKNPGQWAVYSKGNLARTGHSKAQQYKVRYPGSEWIVRSEEGKYTVFGRWSPDVPIPVLVSDSDPDLDSDSDSE